MATKRRPTVQRVSIEDQPNVQAMHFERKPIQTARHDLIVGIKTVREEEAYVQFHQVLERERYRHVVREIKIPAFFRKLK